MATWTDRTWTLAVADMDGAATIRDAAKTNQFELEVLTLSGTPMLLNGKPLAYSVKFNPGDMTSDWKDVILFPRGTAAPRVPPELSKLPPFGAGVENDYKVMAKLVLSEAAPITERLEGDMIVNGKAEALTLYQVASAIVGGGELLIVKLRETNSGQGQLHQDGNGAGF